MPTKQPRLNIVLEERLMKSVGRLAKRDGVSLSLKARDLIRDALELQEDLYWEKVADERVRTFPRRGLTHQQVWK